MTVSSWLKSYTFKIMPMTVPLIYLPGDDLEIMDRISTVEKSTWTCNVLKMQLKISKS